MSAADALECVARSLGDRARRDEPLGTRTTYRVGGAAALWVEADDEDDLLEVARALAEAPAPVAVLVVGKGSNLLVADAGFRGLAVGLGAGFSWVAIEGTTARAGGATGFPVLARRTAAAGLRGLEWAVGVPGSVGGALRMNAGGHGAQTAQVLSGYRVVDLGSGEALDCQAGDLAASYRRSSIGAQQVVVAAGFALEAGDARQAQDALSEVVRWRRAHQPGGSNAGSVFTNPEGTAAGKLIEDCGLKGLRLGSAQVSAKHANFFQADDGGSADDVRRLVDHVRCVVAERTGVELVPELCMVGFEGPGSPSSGGRG